jgi:hypothetical protein
VAEASGLIELELSLLRWCFRGLEIPGEAASRLAEEAAGHTEALRRHKIDSLLYIGCSLDAPAQRVYDKVWKCQREALLTLIGLLLERGISPIVFKGGEFLAASFDPHAVGLNNDVDLLVHAHELGAAKQALYTMGYSQSLFDPELGKLVDRDVQEVGSFESRAYELAPFNRAEEEVELEADELEFARAWQSHPLWVVGDRAVVVTTFDVHHGVAYDVGGEEFFPRAVTSALGVGRAMSAADQLWFTTSRFYNEVAVNDKNTLRDFAYIASLLRDAEIDWDIVLGATDKYDLRPSLYYYLAFLNMLGGVVPEGVLRELLPSKGSRHRDWGWQLSKLFSLIDPFPLPLQVDSVLSADSLLARP